MRRIEIEAGQRFNRLVVIREDGKIYGTKRCFLCRCDCLNTTRVQLSALTGGQTKSCGCYNLEQLTNIPRHVTHGLSNEPGHRKWSGMMRRCYGNPDEHPHYSGRGIRVCRAWREDFFTYQTWLFEQGWTLGSPLEVDRKNNDGHYTPENCRLVTPLVQQWNRQRTLWVHFKGRRVAFAELWHAHGKVHYGTARRRFVSGNWSLKDALQAPIRRRVY